MFAPSQSFEAFDPFIPELFERRTHLLAAFEAVATKSGGSKEDAGDAFALLPKALRAAPVALSLLDNEWRYHFGKPYTGLPNGTVVLGTPQMPRVDVLFRTVRAIRDLISASQHSRIFKQLGDEAKHGDFLEEFAPVLRLNGIARVEYEVPGDNGASIEFRIEKPVCKPMLLEVKNRHKDLIHHLGHFTTNEAAGIPEADIPPPEPDWLFKSVERKFFPAAFDAQAQGVWIHSNISIPKDSLHAHFDGIDPEKLHFAVLSAGEDRAYILARTAEISLFVQEFFDLKHHAHCVR